MYLGQVINEDFEEEDGEPWYVEKQVNICLGGLMTNDFNFLIK